MASDLHEKEEEYRAINNQLELKTKQLLEEVNYVMKIQDTILREPDVRLSNSYVHIENKNSLYYDQSPTSSSQEHAGSKKAAQFLRAKISSMHNDYAKLQQEFHKKCDEIKRLQKETQTLNEEKEKWFRLHNTQKTASHKMESQLSLLQSKLQSKENENLGLRKELDQVKKEFKSATANHSAADAKVNKLTDELENVKTFLKTTKQEQKEIKDMYKKQISDLTNELKRHERNKSEFLLGFKKLLQIIDNVKKQKLQLEALKFGENMDHEFLKLLEWKTED